ncbi:MAG: methyltransferase domain-containing protein [Richelia sp. RM2_1_2]|nr:methyltransferase domain-containing protein [Richelia sp. RM1_1_1]NJO64356.1 methyltransferase domain-containing protein [Richelia sp. RM2_1_2]
MENNSMMSDVRVGFYKKTITKWISNKEASILVVGGGVTDQSVLLDAGFKNVVISNLDTRLKGDEFAPYKWSFQKAEQLDYKDGEFDFVVVHAALHHCESPHRALLEMYRVSKIGIIAFESRDSWLMKIVETMGLTQSYEHVAVYYNDGKFGGVNNTEIPNYIYRWTEREIEKTVNTYAPYARHRFDYQYGSDIPFQVSVEKKALFKSIFVSSVKPIHKVFSLLFPKQQNLFAFYVEKPKIPDDLYPWIQVKDEKLKFNYAWAKEIYK